MAFGDSTLSLVIGLTSFSPTPGCPSLDLYRHVYLVRAVHDGVHVVDDYWHETRRSGFRIWRYRLIKLADLPDNKDEEQSGIEVLDAPSEDPGRETTVLRIVRDTRQARRIKVLYDYGYQMCGVRLEGLAGLYAEAAHIRPLGTPHNGPDTSDNILCLCPNHHVLFDHGGVMIGEDLSLVGAQGRLTVHPRHSVNEDHFATAGSTIRSTTK